MNRASACAMILGSLLLYPALAFAQAQPAQGPLPQLPPSTPQQPPPSTAQQPPPPPPPPPPPYGQPQYAPGTPPPPPVVVYEEPPPPKHAPKFALWLGGRLGFLGFGGYFYDNEQGQGETTGNFLRNGLSLGGDIGARLGKRYIPYVFIEHGFMGQGHRFDGSSASSSTDLYGFGFRYIAGDVDSAGFLSDLSIGIRQVTVREGGDTFSMSSLEIFRLGLGAEIRLSNHFTLSPMGTLSGGSMSDTSGNVQFSPNGSGDGIKQPTYRNGQQIRDSDTRGYVVVGIQCGAHFDLFGK